MRKHYLYLVFIFLTAFSSFAQKVTLTPTSVNGSAFGGTINLGGTPYSSISLGVKVDMPTIPDNNGTVTVYVVSGLNPTIAIGGNNIPIFFGGTKSATQSFVININWGSISTLGGQLYAEYKTSAGVVYRSSSVAITKSATMSGGGNPQAPADAPNPANIANTLCCNQTIRVGEKPAPITGSQYANPYQYEPYGINSIWATGGNNSSARFSKYDGINQIFEFDYVTQLGDFTITRSLGYNSDKTLSNKSNTVTITVIPSPLNSNTISLDAPNDLNGYAEITSTNPKEVNGSLSVMNVTTLQNPTNVPKRSDKYTTIERYEWEYNLSPGTNIWINIPNENSSSIISSNIPNPNAPQDAFLTLRRIAIYENLRIASNPLKIVLRSIRNNNTICCDQKLKIISSQEIEKPSLIIGSNAVSENNSILIYQWQKRPINNRESISNWSNILGATSKDYSPPPLQYTTNPRGNTIQDYSYRRIAETNYYIGGEVSYSNEVSISPNYDRPSASSIIIYPNPATSIINIENKENVFTTIDTKVSIVDIMGTEVNSNNYSLINPNLISINISNLIPGTYFINLQSLLNGRRSVIQFTFIKQ